MQPTCSSVGTSNISCDSSDHTFSYNRKADLRTLSGVEVDLWWGQAFNRGPEVLCLLSGETH